MISLWARLGSTMLILLAGLQGTPTHLDDATEVDGATLWNHFWDVTIPMTSPVIFSNLILGIIGSFQSFTVVCRLYTLTGSAGPSDSGRPYLVYLYRNAFQYFRVSYAAALSCVHFLIILGLTFLMFHMQTR